MGHLSIRDLQKISGEAIQKLPGPTAIKSGGRTIALLTPLKKADPERMRAWAERVEALAKTRDPAEDERILREAGADLTDWSIEATERFIESVRRGG